MDDAVTTMIEKHKKDSSINKIKSFVQNRFSFEFQPIDRESILKEIRLLKVSKACQESDVPTKVLKKTMSFLKTLSILLLMDVFLLKYISFLSNKC